MLFRNLGVGSEQRCSHSRACVGAGCGCAARLFLQSSGLLLTGAESGNSTAASTRAARLKSTARQHAHALWLWRSSQSLGAWPVHGDGALTGLASVEREKVWYQMHIESHIRDVLRARRISRRRGICICICRAPHLGCCWRIAPTSPCYCPGAVLGRGDVAPITRSQQAVIAEMLERGLRHHA
jgi:hypothetical protein